MCPVFFPIIAVIGMAQAPYVINTGSKKKNRDVTVLDSCKLKILFIEFFKEKGHEVIPNASLVPETDPTVLFTTAGMHPLVPYLLGQPHPLGKRLVNVQKCLRTDDIDEVGDNSHLTFFRDARELVLR